MSSENKKELVTFRSGSESPALGTASTKHLRYESARFVKKKKKKRQLWLAHSQLGEKRRRQRSKLGLECAGH